MFFDQATENPCVAHCVSKGKLCNGGAVRVHPTQWGSLHTENHRPQGAYTYDFAWLSCRGYAHDLHVCRKRPSGALPPEVLSPDRSHGRFGGRRRRSAPTRILTVHQGGDLQLPHAVAPLRRRSMTAMPISP